MTEAYILDAVRTPTGRRRGGLSNIHGADLGAHVLKTLVDRNNIPDVDYDDVIFGCVDTIGPLAGDIASVLAVDAGNCLAGSEGLPFAHLAVILN